MKRILTVLVLAFAATAAAAAEPARFLAETPDSVLFVGNSFTGGTLNLYAHTQAMALAAADPDTMVVRGYIDGGKSLSYHWNLGEAQKRIRVGGWDVVVIQEFTAYPDNIDSTIYYAGLFKALIDSIGAQTVIYMTHDNMLHDIADVQFVMDSVGNLYDVPVVPCGLTHEIVKAEHPYLDPLFDPYTTDAVHPGSVGRLLNICTFYTAFTRKSPVGVPYDPGIYEGYSDADLRYIQSASWDLMRDYIEGPCTDSTTAPTVPAGLAGEARTITSVVLTWTESSHAACGVRKYNVYRDGAYAGSAYQPVFKDTSLLGGTEYEYTVTALSLGGVESAASAPVAVTTVADTIAPELLAVPTTKRATRIELLFSEELDSATAESPANYTIDNGITVTAAALTGSRVSLTVSPLSEDVTYTVTVTGVKDNATAANAVPAGSQASFEYVAPILMEHCIAYFPFEQTLEDYSPSGLEAGWKYEPSFTAAGYDRYGVECIGTIDNSFPIIYRQPVLNNLPAFSIAMWIRKGAADEDGLLVHKNGELRLDVTATGIKGVVTTADTSASFDTTTALLQDTEWHHVALTYDGSMVRVYVDAQEVCSAPLTGTTAINSNINVGNYAYGTDRWRSFYGIIDEFRMYDAALDSISIAALYLDNTGMVAAADSVAVQEIIQQNMLITSVGEVAVRDASSGRVLACNFDSSGIYRIIEEVGQLTAMRALYCAGDSTADSLLTLIDPALGTCTALETLVLKDNQLTELPDEITNLTNLALLDVSGNMLCNVSAQVEAWLDTYDSDWADGQNGCASSIAPTTGTRPSIRLPSGTLLDAQGRAVNANNAVTGVYLQYDEAAGRMKKVLIIR